MKNKLILKAAVAAGYMAFIAAAQATPITATLTLSDNNGNSQTVNAVNGLAVFNGVIGSWTINVTTGIASPPDLGIGTVTSPYLDLNTVDKYMGHGVGNVLTLSWVLTGIGPLSGSILSDLGGTLSGSIHQDKFSVLVDGVLVSGLNYTGSTAAFSDSASAGVGSGSTIEIRDIMTAGNTSGTSSFDHQVTVVPVPDGGVTVILLGAAFSAMGLLRKKLMA